MILHPGILALLLSSALTSFLVLYSAPHLVSIVRSWNLSSGSETQLGLERKTYLISTLWTYALGFEVISFFLFLFTADSLHTLFYGAMCAAGTLNVNRYGYPLLLLKVAVVLLAGAWLVLNRADNRAYDYPLVRTKYAALLCLTPLFVAEAVLQALYFLNLEADVITSCCGSLFSSESSRIASELAALPPGPTRVAFFAVLALLGASGFGFLRLRRGALVFSALSVTAFAVSVASLISFVCLYFYEMPSHHCPFCILQREYGYVGYALYASLFGGGVSGLGVGALHPFRGIPSLRTVVPALQRKLAWACLAAYAGFAALAVYRMLTADFRLGPG